jgi:hypothetical protein
LWVIVRHCAPLWRILRHFASLCVIVHQCASLRHSFRVFTSELSLKWATLCIVYVRFICVAKPTQIYVSNHKFWLKFLYNFISIFIIWKLKVWTLQ